MRGIWLGALALSYVSLAAAQPAQSAPPVAPPSALPPPPPAPAASSAEPAPPAAPAGSSAEPAPPIAPPPAAQPVAPAPPIAPPVAQPVAPQPVAPPPGYYYAPYAYYYAPPPPPSEPPETESKFYMSFAIGPGLFRAHNDVAVDQRHFTGGSLSTHLFLGRRVGRIVALGVAYVHDQIFSLASHDDVHNGNEPNLDQTAFTIDSACFFQDWFVPAVPGLHFPTWIGFSFLTEHQQSASRSSDPTLFLFGGGAGYAFDVGAHFRVGALLRASIASYHITENKGVDVTTFIPALMLDASYDASSPPGKKPNR